MTTSQAELASTWMFPLINYLCLLYSLTRTATTVTTAWLKQPFSSCSDTGIENYSDTFLAVLIATHELVWVVQGNASSMVTDKK